MYFTISGNNLNVIVPSTSHPRLLHIIKPPSELDEKRIERRKSFTDVQDLRIWNIIRVLLVHVKVVTKMFYYAIPHLCCYIITNKIWFELDIVILKKRPETRLMSIEI